MGFYMGISIMFLTQKPSNNFIGFNQTLFRLPIFANQVWNPYLTKDIQVLEHVQKFALREHQKDSPKLTNSLAGYKGCFTMLVLGHSLYYNLMTINHSNFQKAFLEIPKIKALFKHTMQG